MQSSIWKAIPVLRNSLIPSPHFARFHSTPISLAKWNTKWDNKDEGSSQKPSKNQIRFAVRQKRADTKKALKDFLLYGKPPKRNYQDEGLNGGADEISSRNGRVKNSSHGFDNFTKPKSSASSKPHGSSNPGKGKRGGGSKSRRHKQRFYDIDDDERPSKIFEATFGGQRCYTWSFTPSENCRFNFSTAGFEWRDDSRSERSQSRVWSESDLDDDDDYETATAVGCRSHRVTLGLPPTGPLKLDDVKSAFRAAALKWHPDKHQGPSLAMAEEKFKLCVDAYNSLCNAVKAA